MLYDPKAIAAIRALRQNHAEDCEPRHKFRERYCTCGAYAWNEAIDAAADALLALQTEED